MRRIKPYQAVTLTAVILTIALPASAWLARGHMLMSKASVALVAGDLPEFFSLPESARAIADASVEADALRDMGDVALRNTEAPNHYWASELLTDWKLPADRIAFYRLCQEKNLTPSKSGALYYTLLESLARLEVAFAQHRRWPEDPGAKARCLVYAGYLAHFAQDLNMPLHTTIHHDGRTKPDGSSSRTGIHFRMDDLPGRLDLDWNDVITDLHPQVMENPGKAILAQIALSNAQVDRVYELNDQLPKRDEEGWTPTPEIRELGLERSRAAVAFTASLWLTAWHRSEAIAGRTPPWLSEQRNKNH
jgi:hypothetical protein